MNNQVRVLILEDNLSDAELVKRELCKSGLDFAVELAVDEDGFVRALDEFIPDLILADYSVPGFDGLTALALARQRIEGIPVIIVSGAIGEETAIETLKAGATDYVLKQRLARLGPVVQRGLWEAKQVAEKNRAEEALSRSERQLRLIIDAGPTLISYVDTDCRYRWVNRVYEEWFGRTAEEVHGQRVQDVLGEAAWQAVRPYAEQALAGETVSYEMELAFPGREPRWLHATYTPDRDESGQVRGFVVQAMDIGKLKRVEREREDLLKREHHIAEMLQQMLIPPEVPYEMVRITVVGRYQAALQEAKVGGDFYDVFELGENKLGILIGDVVGKGLQAAIRVAAVRYSVRSYAYLEPSPAKVMTLVNRTVMMESDNAANMLTAFFAVVDAVSGAMTYACAGHEPPVICGARDSVKELSVTGPMLGVLSNSVYSEETCQLNAGDTVVMFTDGITEARNNGSKLFQKTGVIEHLKRACDADPDEIAEALLNAATAHAGGSLQDDAAVVVMGVAGDSLV